MSPVQTPFEGFTHVSTTQSEIDEVSLMSDGILCTYVRCRMKEGAHPDSGQKGAGGAESSLGLCYPCRKVQVFDV